jgi:Tol biopolymer transport system component
MRQKLIIVHCLLFTSFLFLLSCQSTPQTPTQTALLLYRFDPPAFLEYSEDLQLIKEIPFSIPPNCGLYNTFPAPMGQFLLIELSCPNGQTVLFLDTSTSLSAGSESASVSQPITSSDSHFLAWTSDGKAAYLKADTLGNTQILRVHTDGDKDVIPITGWTYDLSTKPDSRDFIFTFSRGLGYGSELHLAQHDGRITQLLYADQYNYISFARFSPNGRQIAFIKIPDTQTPFTIGELWVMDADGSNSRKLADVDAGHGYAANWSPDGSQIAFVVRENPEDESANQSSDALTSNVYIVNVETGGLNQVTSFDNARVETPFWSPDGNTLAFAVVINGRMQMHIADVNSVPNPEIRLIEAESTCCPAWMRK